MSRVIQPNLAVIVGKNEQILLPGAVMRLKVISKDTVALVDSIYNEFLETHNVMVAFVPTITDSHTKQVRLNETGVASNILEIFKTTIGSLKSAYILTIKGVSRIKIQSIIQTTPFQKCSAIVVKEEPLNEKQVETAELLKRFKSLSNELISRLELLEAPESLIQQMQRIMSSTEPGLLTDLIATLTDVSYDQMLVLLEESSVQKRLAIVTEFLLKYLQQEKQQPNGMVKRSMGKRPPSSLSSFSSMSTGQSADDMKELEKRLEDAQIPTLVKKIVDRELAKFKKMPVMNPESHVLRTYLELVADLPWSVATSDNLDLQAARTQLDKDHYGMKDAKTRILEFLAVKKLTKSLNGPILCLVGAPGVGKTSLGQSVANSMGRKFHRIALGGVRDESEIRGHRRTYVGALPGMILNALKRVEVKNPVILLDEIDKLSRDGRGDPAAALLEVLDPAQNSTFTDHYLNLPFDLSQVLFIATANTLDSIPAPLIDRMEIIRLPGYTFEDKVSIAKSFIIPKQVQLHGLSTNQFLIGDDSILEIASSYTREAGVRNLEKKIASMCRQMAMKLVTLNEEGVAEQYDPLITVERVARLLGDSKYTQQVLELQSTPGVSIGLAWTADGSGGLLFIESTLMPGTSQVKLTGQLGSVIQESASIAVSWVRSNIFKLVERGFPISKSFTLKDLDIHIHFPAGSIPKDGPSAGVTIVIALVSLVSGLAMKSHLAMTGEVTLRGQVLAVGGIKEKVLAAYRAGVETCLLPRKNENDIKEIDTQIKQKMKFVFVDDIWQAIEASFGTQICVNSSISARL